MNETVSDVVRVSESLGGDIRRSLGLGPDAELRVTYISGPGDVGGTFDHWRNGDHDPRVPSVAFSLMFYELMAKLGARAQIFTRHDSPPAPTSINGAAFQFEQLVPRAFGGKLGYFRSKRDFVKRMMPYIRAFDPHVVIASTDTSSLAWKDLGRGRKLILEAHNTFWPMGRPPQSLKQRVKKQMLSLQSAALDGAICTSPECARQIADVTGGRIQGLTHWPQIVARYDPRPGTRARNLLYLGRIERAKGVFLLLDAFRTLTATYPDLTLTFAGGGRAEEALRARLDAGQDPNVEFVGLLDSEGVHRQLGNSDLLICPTMTGFNEGLGLVGFEAAAHGVPSVLSSIVPALDLLGDGCAVFEADNGAALAETLEGLVGNDAAYRDLCAGIMHAREKIYDRSLSWGTQLGNEMVFH